MLNPYSESFLNHPLISNAYFFPRREGPPKPFWIKSDNQQLSCYYDNSFPLNKTVIFFHGNGEVVKDYLDIFPEFFKSLECNLLMVEYRQYGRSTGKAQLASMLIDVENVVRQLKIPEHKIIFFGRSIGALYASHGVYKFPRAAGLILESGVADLAERLLLRLDPTTIGVSEKNFIIEVGQYFSPKTKLSYYKGNSLIIHCLKDSLVSVDHANKNLSYLAGNKSLKLFELGDHNDILATNKDAYFNELTNFIQNI